MNEFIRERQDIEYEKALIVQKEFMALAEKDGYFCIPSWSSQDRDEHWDVLMIKGSANEELYVDVKNEKDVTKKHDCTWLEEKNTEGKTGWLFAPKLNGIVFEKSDRFIYVDIHGLRQIYDEKVEDKLGLVYGGMTKPKNVLELLYKRYYRLGMENQPRYDTVVLVRFSDIDKYILKTFMK